MDPNFKIENNGLKRTISVKGTILNLAELKGLQDVKEQFFCAIGKFGKWQMLKSFYVVLVIWLPLSFHILNMVFFR